MRYIPAVECYLPEFVRRGAMACRGLSLRELSSVNNDELLGTASRHIPGQRHHREAKRPRHDRNSPLCKTKRQYLLTCKVSRYRLLVLRGTGGWTICLAAFATHSTLLVARENRCVMRWETSVFIANKLFTLMISILSLWDRYLI